MKEFKIKQEPMLLQNFLKLNDFTSTGGQAKYYLQENEVLVNGEREIRRGKKLYHDDVVCVENQEFKIVLDVD